MFTNIIKGFIFGDIYRSPRQRHVTDDDAEDRMNDVLFRRRRGGRVFEMRQFSTVDINSYKSDKSCPTQAPGAGASESV